MRKDHMKERPLTSVNSALLTFRFSTGLVTLNLSMVEIMMAGVVRKKSRMRRTVLMEKHLIHQENPLTDRCSLCSKVKVGGAGTAFHKEVKKKRKTV